MIISDLNHLEVVSEASSVVGGGKYKDKYDKLKLKIDIDITKQSNVSIINQTATAVAISYKGDATATAVNEAKVVQVNKA